MVGYVDKMRLWRTLTVVRNQLMCFRWHAHAGAICINQLSLTARTQSLHLYRAFLIKKVMVHLH